MAIKFGHNGDVDFTDGNLMVFAKSFSAMYGQPLDNREVWYDKSELEKAAKGTTTYVGQKVCYVDTKEGKVHQYSIQSDETLRELAYDDSKLDKKFDSYDQLLLTDSSGNVITGTQLNTAISFRAPSTTGGLTRGIRWYQADGETCLGGIGAHGSNGTLTSFYIGFGADPWKSENSLYVSEDNIQWKKQSLIHNGNIGDQTVKSLTGLNASVAELNHVKGVTSSIQTQLDGKAPTSHASTDTTYGAATTTTYGHVKLYTADYCTTYEADDGALTPSAVRKYFSYKDITALPTDTNKCYPVNISTGFTLNGVNFPKHAKGMFMANGADDATLFVIAADGTIYTAYRNGNTWQNARTFIHNGNIGDQTVSVADKVKWNTF